MAGGSPRWPHRQYTESTRLDLHSEDLSPRLVALSVRAARLLDAVEGLLSEPKGPTILVVEDDSVARKALGGILTLEGWVVAQAGTLADGLAGLEPPPICVILDLMLPDGDGSTILEFARSLGLEIRFVVTTGVEDPARLRALARLEPDALFQKPVPLEDLCQACLGPGS